MRLELEPLTSKVFEVGPGYGPFDEIRSFLSGRRRG